MVNIDKLDANISHDKVIQQVLNKNDYKENNENE